MRLTVRWNSHIDSIVAECNQRLFLPLHLKRSGVPAPDLVSLYKATIRSVLEYVAPVWHSSVSGHLSKGLENIQKRALRIIFEPGQYKAQLASAGLTTPPPPMQETLHQYHKSRTPTLFPTALTASSLIPIAKAKTTARTTRTNWFTNCFVLWAIWVFDWPCVHF